MRTLRPIRWVSASPPPDRPLPAHGRPVTSGAGGTSSLELRHELHEDFVLAHFGGVQQEGSCDDPNFCPPRMKKAWIHMPPSLLASAKTSASLSPSGIDRLGCPG